MKKLLLLLIFLGGFNAFSQVTNEGQPVSWKLLKSQDESIKPITLPSFDLQAIQEEDRANENKAMPWRFGYMHSVDYGLEEGVWTELENGDRIWRIKFNSPGALSLNVVFDNFYLPEGGKVYLYNDDKSDLLGAYTNVQNQESGILGTWLVKGETLWIEYYEPFNVKNQGSLEIKKITHGYRSADTFNAEKALNDSGDCNLDVDCSVGADWQGFKEHNKRAVGILLTAGGAGFCTGALVNNTNNDGTPYFLTANHCFSDPAAWSFRFGWISPDPVCAEATPSTDGPTDMTISGATLRARNAGSDFCLVEINSAIPPEWNRTWSGWNRTTTPAPFVVGIHHPAGDIMKVCRDDSGVIAAVNAGAQTWEITTAGGGWEIGVTEPGSSGSPLYDHQGNIIGQLFGGGAACSGTADNDLLDYYGRFDVSWDGTGETTRLRDWLDPTGSDPDIIGPFPSIDSFALDLTVSISFPEIECGTTEVNPVINVSNFGTTTITSAEITWNFNGGPDTVINYSGSLDQYDSEQIDLETLTLVEGNNTLNVSIANPNDMADENAANDSGSDTYFLEEFDTSQVHLTLLTDDWAEETTWEFRDAVGNVLYSGGPYQQTVDDNTEFLESFDISPDACYTFVINDAAGDGICCGFGLGAYDLKTDDDTIIFAGGQFGATEETEIKIRGPLSVDEFSIADIMSLYPNPTTNGILNIVLNTNNNRNLSYSLISTTGQVVKKGALQNGENTINVSAISSGFYFVRVQDSATQLSHVEKVVIN